MYLVDTGKNVKGQYKISNIDNTGENSNIQKATNLQLLSVPRSLTYFCKLQLYAKLT